MSTNQHYLWLKWVQKLQAIAQNGLTYTKDVFDKQRYEELQQIAAEIASQYSDAPQEKILHRFEHETGYATPKVDVRGAVFNDNKILLVQEKSDQLWSLPGGWVDIHESPSEAVIKENSEESGFSCKANKLIALYDMEHHEHPPQSAHIYKIIILCELIAGKPETSVETSDVRFFAEDNLPPLSIDRITYKQIKRIFEHKRNINLPTDFD